MKPLTALALALAAASLIPLSTAADARPRKKAGVVTSDGNVTGGRNRDRARSRGATGADTVQSNSAAGGNANQPARAAPQGSGGGASGGNN